MADPDFHRFCGSLLVSVNRRKEVKATAKLTQATMSSAREEKERLQRMFSSFKRAASRHEDNADQLMKQNQMGSFADTQDFGFGSEEDDSEEDGYSSEATGSLLNQKESLLNQKKRDDWTFSTVRARLVLLSALRVCHSKSVFYGAFVWACRPLNSQ